MCSPHEKAEFGANKEWGIRFNGAYRDGRGEIDRSSLRYGFASLGLDYRGERVRISADLGYQAERNRSFQALRTVVPGIAIPKAPRARNNLNQEWELGDNQHGFGATRAEFDVTDWLTVYAAYGRSNNKDLRFISTPQIFSAQGDYRQNGFSYEPFDITSFGYDIGARALVETGPIRHKLVVSTSAVQQETDYLSNRIPSLSLLASTILGGTGFIFPFHFNLHITAGQVGYWIVGLAGMAMLVLLVLLVSGVVIHARIFRDFFLLRAGRKPQRTVLDLHNVAGVLGLPFHFVMTLSGLVIFFAIYFPASWQTAFGGDRAAFNREAYGAFSRPAAGQPAPAASLDAIVAEAERRWGGSRAYFVRVWHPGDAASYVEVRRSYADAITMNLDQAYFDATTGAVLHTHTASPVMHVQRVISGLHFIQFRHWTLRFVYFSLGLLGCVLIATGFLFWVESRRKRYAVLGWPGVRLVEGLAVGSVTGIVLATAAFLVANRLLPLGIAGRAGWEMAAFYAVWAVAFVHAWARPGAAWREQAWAIAATALLAVGLNAATTGDHPLRAIAARHGGVAGVDVALLAGAAIAAATARSLSRQPRTAARPAPAAE